MAEAVKASKNATIANITKYLKEVKSEFKKVIWPTRKQVINNTMVVIASIIVVGVVIWVLDLGFGSALGKLYGR